MARKRILFSPAGCSLCEACVSLAPDCFEVDPDTGMVTQKQECVEEDLARELCNYCPEECIESEDADDADDS